MLTSRKWEELDAFNAEDESAFTDTADETESFSDNGASAAGRRGMIETALAKVRDAARTPYDSSQKHMVGALIFDAAAAKFARVKKSSGTGVLLNYLSGGTKEYSAGASKAAKDAPAAPKKVAAPVNEPPVKAEKAEKKEVVAAPVAAKVQEKRAVPTPPLAVKASPVPQSSKNKKGKEDKKVDRSAVKKSPKIVAKKSAAQLGDASEMQLDPVADPNTYIQQNYLYLSNKQLAGLTGLSEHTIRRKLGEWGLKRSVNNG